MYNTYLVITHVFISVSAWILTRDRVPTEETKKQAFKVVDKNNISRAPYLITDQSNCPISE